MEARSLPFELEPERDDKVFKVLVVEDEQYQRKGLVKTFPWDAFNCEVIGAAANGLEGLEMIKLNKPDIVFTDIKMPFMDGITMLEKGREYKNYKSVIISGYGEFKLAQKAINLGVDAYLLKPIDFHDFNEVMEKIIQQLGNNNYEEELKELKIVFPEMHPLDPKGIEVCTYIIRHYSEQISASMIATALNISDDSIYNILTNNIGVSLKVFLVKYRLFQACKLLKEEPFTKVYEIASRIGFTNYKYFHSVFIRTFGMSPTEYRFKYESTIKNKKG